MSPGPLSELGLMQCPAVATRSGPTLNPVQKPGPGLLPERLGLLAGLQVSGRAEAWASRAGEPDGSVPVGRHLAGSHKNGGGVRRALLDVCGRVIASAVVAAIDNLSADASAGTRATQRRSL